MSLHTASGARTAAVLARVRRHPLLLHSIVVFGLGWPAVAAAAITRQRHGPGGGVLAGRPAEEWLALAYVLLCQLPAAFVATWIADEWAGVRGLTRSALRWRVGVYWAAAFAFGLPAIAMVVALVAGGRWREGVGLSTLGVYLWSLVARVTSINLWEEVTWAGFFQWRLQQRHGLVRAALVTSLPFAAMHVAIFYVDGAPSGFGILTLLVFSALFRFLQGTVLAATGGSALAAALVHAAFNSTNNPEGVLRAAIVGVDLSWEALVAAVVLATVFVFALRQNQRESRDQTGCPRRSSACSADVSGSGSASRSVRSSTASRS